MPSHESLDAATVATLCVNTAAPATHAKPVDPLVDRNLLQAQPRTWDVMQFVTTFHHGSCQHGKVSSQGAGAQARSYLSHTQELDRGLDRSNLREYIIASSFQGRNVGSRDDCAIAESAHDTRPRPMIFPTVDHKHFGFGVVVMMKQRVRATLYNEHERVATNRKDVRTRTWIPTTPSWTPTQTSQWLSAVGNLTVRLQPNTHHVSISRSPAPHPQPSTPTLQCSTVDSKASRSTRVPLHREAVATCKEGDHKHARAKKPRAAERVFRSNSIYLG